jgi:hypothetical protein
LQPDDQATGAALAVPVQAAAGRRVAGAARVGSVGSGDPSVGVAAVVTTGVFKPPASVCGTEVALAKGTGDASKV